MKNLILLVLILSIVGCSDDRNNLIQAPTQVTIGDQVWSTKNLNVMLFNNGDTIPHIEDDSTWNYYGENDLPAWCYLENRESNRQRFGRLYNYHVVFDQRGIAPEGWHVATGAEWREMITYLGDNPASDLKSENGWYGSGNGNGTTGFKARPGGVRFSEGQFFLGDLGLIGFWWSSETAGQEDAILMEMRHDTSIVLINSEPRDWGCSIRCVKD